MKLTYYKETDTLYIELSENKSIESVELQNGVIADIDEKGNFIGIEIENASKVIDFTNFSIDIPFMDLINKQKSINKQVA